MKDNTHAKAAAKILLAEDSQECLTRWLGGLQAAGMDMEGRSHPEIIAQAQKGLAVLRHGANEMHITAQAAETEKAVQDHRYAVCFMDGMLAGGTSYPATRHLLKNTDSKVYLISDASHVQASVLNKTEEGIDMESLKRAGRVEVSVKNYHLHSRLVTETLGLATPAKSAGR